MCDSVHHKSYGSGLTAVNKVSKCIVYILGGDFFFNLLRFVAIWFSHHTKKKSLEKYSTFCCYKFYITLFVYHKLISDHYVLLPQIFHLRATFLLRLSKICFKNTPFKIEEFKVCKWPVKHLKWLFIMCTNFFKLVVNHLLLCIVVFLVSRNII